MRRCRPWAGRAYGARKAVSPAPSSRVLLVERPQPYLGAYQHVVVLSDAEYYKGPGITWIHQQHWGLRVSRARELFGAHD